MSTTATPTEAEFLTVEEAAALLRVSRATAYRLVDAGEIPAIRVGGQLRVDRAELLSGLRPARNGDKVTVSIDQLRLCAAPGCTNLTDQDFCRLHGHAGVGRERAR